MGQITNTAWKNTCGTLAVQLQHGSQAKQNFHSNLDGVELDRCASGHEMSSQQSVVASSSTTQPGSPWESRSLPTTSQLHLFSGLLNSPKTKMINGIMLVVFPFPFVQVSLWRCNLETTDWIVVPGAWVPNPPNADGCTPVAFWGLGFGKVKALLRKPRHQRLLVGDPLNSVG